MAQWPAFTPTRFPEIGLTQCAPDLWRYVDTDTAAIVGPQYRTKAEALADLERYAFENWGLGTRPTADPVRDAAPDLLEALKALADAVSPGARGAPRSTRPVRAALETAADAIAKAEGR